MRNMEPNLLEQLVEQAQRDSKDWFGDTTTVDDLGFHALALCGETGEFANLVKKIERGTSSYEEVQQLLREELIDVFTYMLNIAGILEMDVLQEYTKKRTINQNRFTIARRIRNGN